MQNIIVSLIRGGKKQNPTVVSHSSSLGLVLERGIVHANSLKKGKNIFFSTFPSVFQRDVVFLSAALYHSVASRLYSSLGCCFNAEKRYILQFGVNT